MDVELFIDGTPRPAGSKRAFLGQRKDGSHFANVVDDCKTSAGWKADVREAFRRRYQGEPTKEPVRLDIVFTLPRPKSHFRTGRHADKLRDDAPTTHTSKPDRGKLLRAVEDALTGVAWVDDAQVCAGEVSKVYGKRVGVWIMLKTIATR